MTRPIVSDKNFEKRIRQDALKRSGEGIDLEGSSFDPSAECFNKKNYYQYIENGYEWIAAVGVWYRDEDIDDDDDDDWEISNYGIDPELRGRYGIDFDDEVGFRD